MLDDNMIARVKKGPQNKQKHKWQKLALTLKKAEGKSETTRSSRQVIGKGVVQVGGSRGQIGANGAC